MQAFYLFVHRFLASVNFRQVLGQFHGSVNERNSFSAGRQVRFAELGTECGLGLPASLQRTKTQSSTAASVRGVLKRGVLHIASCN